MPIHRAGPTRCGSSAGARDSRTMYITKIPTSTIESINVIECLSGRVSEYPVATSRNAISTACGLARRISFMGWGGVPSRRGRRERYQAMNTTELQPMPMSNRFAPVMFASAREHGDASPSGLGQLGP